MPLAPEPRHTRVTRRGFSRHAAAVAAGILAVGVVDAAEEAPKAGPEPPVAPPSANDAVVEQIIAQCPGLPESDRKELGDQVKSVMDLARSLRALKVQDGLEPDFVFRAAKEASGAR